MIKVTFEVQTQEEFEFAYQRLMPSLGEVCDGVGMKTIVGIVKGKESSGGSEENALMDWLNTRREWMLVDERPHPLTQHRLPPSPVERGEFNEIDYLEKEALILRTLKKLDDEELVEIRGLLRNTTVEDVSLEMMQDDTTPLVDRAIQKSGLCNVLDFLGKKGNI